jgi:hypothetical protein
VHHWPHEILYELFLHASAPFYPFRDGFSWILGRACWRWRAVAFSTQALRGSYVINLRVPRLGDVTKDSFHRKTTLRLTECIARSGQHPLSLIVAGAATSCRDSDYIDIDITLLHRHAHRFVEVAQLHELEGL